MHAILPNGAKRTDETEAAFAFCEDRNHFTETDLRTVSLTPMSASFHLDHNVVERILAGEISVE